MKHKAIDTLKTFSNGDIKSFRSFLLSPFFNDSMKLLKLFDTLCRYYPLFEMNGLTDEKISKIISPNVPFNSSTMKALFSNLQKKCLEYFAVTSLKNRPVEFSFYLRKELFKRGLHTEAQNNIAEALRKIDLDKDINTDYYLNKFKIMNDKANLSSIYISKSGKESINAYVSNLKNRGRYILYFFLTETVREYENLSAIEMTFNASGEASFIYEIINTLDLEKIFDVLKEDEEKPEYAAVLQTYKALLNSIKSFRDQRGYLEYKNAVVRNMDMLSVDERRFHFRGLIKNCILRRKIFGSSKQIDTELFFLYGYMLTMGIYRSTVNDYLSVDLFRNALKVALRLKKYKWSVSFIKKYVKEINPEWRKNIFFYSLAEYYFARKMFKSALKYFHKIKYEEFLYKVDMKNLMLMANFELKHYETALTIIDSFYHFLSNDKALSKEQKKLYKNFVKTVHLLILYVTSSGKTSLDDIEMFLKNEIPFRSWIKEKLDEIHSQTSGSRKKISS